MTWPLVPVRRIVTGAMPMFSFTAKPRKAKPTELSTSLMRSTAAPPGEATRPPPVALRRARLTLRMPTVPLRSGTATVFTDSPRPKVRVWVVAS